MVVSHSQAPSLSLLRPQPHFVKKVKYFSELIPLIVVSMVKVVTLEKIDQRLLFEPLKASVQLVLFYFSGLQLLIAVNLHECSLDSVESSQQRIEPLSLEHMKLSLLPDVSFLLRCVVNPIFK